MPAFEVRAVPIEATVGEEEMRFADRRFGFREAAKNRSPRTPMIASSDSNC